MMAGMMLPSASPVLLMYGVAARRQASHAEAGRQIYALASGYLAVWALFSVVATAAQFILSTELALSPMMTLTNPRVGALLLVVAGVHQLTPLKRVCLRECQSPLGFLMHHWRGGTAGAFRMGFEHGVYCLGCCWALMLLLFVGGVMNLTVIAALTALVAFEKLSPFGIHTARVSGLLLVGSAAWMLAGL
jgi:predicted metal-binding membrane protein